MWNKGIDVRKIAETFNCKVDSVYKFAHRNQMPKRPPGYKSVLQDESKRRWLIENYPIMSNETCAIFLGISPDRVGVLARKLGLSKSDEYWEGIRQYHLKKVRESIARRKVAKSKNNL